MRARGAVGALLFVVIVACGRSDGVVIPTLVPPVTIPPPPLDPDRVALGAQLYAVHCAECHGTDLRGDPEWMTPAEDGGFRPPPHDSSGHTWHHSDRVLVDTVLFGYDPPVAESRMPQFADTLTADEVLSILEFFKSHWGEEERAYQWEQTLRDESSL